MAEEFESERTSVLKTTSRQVLEGFPVGEACLVLIHGPRLGSRFPLERTLTIGRDPDNDVALDLDRISRHHAEIFPRESAWWVRDLGSTNGSFVNDTRVDDGTKLANGDQVRVGRAILKYLHGGDVESLFHEEIYRTTIFDGLTGVHNRRYFMDFLDRELSRSARYGRDLSLAILDIDHFKDFNDRLGHLAGDHVLRTLCDALKAGVRKEHLFARFGGEEFVLVLPEQGVDEARRYCEKVRELVEGLEVDFNGSVYSVTVSIGLASTFESIGADELIEAADAALYRAKAAGRNRVIAAGDDS